MAALTMLEAAKTLPPGFDRGVIQTYATSYHPMTVMPLITDPTGIMKWNLEYQLPYSSGGVRNINGTWTSTSAQVNPYVENFRIYGGQCQIDRAIAATNVNRVALERESQIKAMGRRFAIDLFEGTGGTYIRGFADYLDNDPAFANQTIDVGTVGAGGTLMTDNLDKLLSKMTIIPGSTFIYCTQTQALRIKKLARGNSATSDTAYRLNFSPEQFGYFSGDFGGVPVIHMIDGKGNDLLSTTQGEGTSSTIWCVTYGPQMVSGLQVKAPEVIPLNQADVYNYFDLEWYVAAAPGAIRSVARLRYVEETV